VSSADPAKVAAILVAQQGVTRQYGSVTSDATLAGLSGTVQLTQFSANPSWARYDLVSGRWFARPGEAVAASELLTASGKHVGDTITVNNTALRIVGEVFDPNDDGHNLLAQAPAGTHFTSWQVEATNPAATAGALDEKLKPLGLTATQADNGDTATLVLVIDSLAGLLTALMVAVAGLGVLNIVVLDVRDRVRDLGIQKALGMTPRQTLISVLASVVPAGLLGGVVGVPVGIAVHGFVLPAMFRAVGSHLPPALLAVYHPAELVAFALAGALLAVVGALLPAGWAARTRTSTALRAE
jgi:putative ABC transport system permease protein